MCTPLGHALILLFVGEGSEDVCEDGKACEGDVLELKVGDGRGLEVNRAHDVDVVARREGKGDGLSPVGHR